MRVLISGGGLAGLTAAYWLRDAGHEPVVIEKSPTLRDDGYGLDFFGAGYDVADRMGLIPALADRQLTHEGDAGVAYVNGDGKILAELKFSAIREVLGGRYLPLMHGNLVDVIRDAVPDDVEIRFGASIAAVDQNDGAVAVTFDNGESESFDLLVGADGIHSNVRNLVFGPEDDYAVYLGYRFACYFLDGDYERSALWDNYVEPRREVGIYSSDDEGRLVAFLLWSDEDGSWIPHTERADRIRSVYEGAGWHADKVIGELSDDGEFLMDTVTQIQMDTWRKGRVVLIGDAAGCMTLISGQGASMALAGAYVLAQELADASDWSQALANYEARVKPQMDIRQSKAHDFAKRFVPGSKAGVEAQVALMKLITHHMFSGLLKTQFVGDSFLTTAALRRLPRSHEDVVGFAVDGKLTQTDYATLSITLDQMLAAHHDVGVLIDLAGFDGIKVKALLDDWHVGRTYHESIRRIAVVGDTRLSSVVAKMSAPTYAKEGKHFAPDEIEDAWSWVEGSSKADGGNNDE